MPLTRYEVRNNYSLCDPEVYRSADKDDPEALLEGVAMAGLVGLLRQLGDLAEFAAEIFHELHEEVMVTAARGHGLMLRVQQLESEFPSIEKTFLSQTSHSSFFSNAGIDWHPNLQAKQNHITQGDLPRFVMESYEECRGPPRLFLLDKFDVAGAGACLKRYTDPSFYRIESSATETENAEVHRDKKSRKTKKKGSRWKNGETPEILPPAHAKLHQLFLEERVENGVSDPARLVKLKRKPNKFPLYLESGKSYMENLLKTPPEDKEVHEISVCSSPLKLPSNGAPGLGLDIPEISASKSGSSVQEIRSPHPPSVDKTVNLPSVDAVHAYPDRGGNMELPMSNPNFEGDGMSILLHELMDEKEIEVDGKINIDGSADGYISDELENYVDALANMESEIETDCEMRAKAEARFVNVERHKVDFEPNREHLQSQFSDSESTNNSTVSDDAGSSRKRISDSASTSADNLLDGDFSVSVYPASDMYHVKIMHKLSDEDSIIEKVPVIQSSEREVTNNECVEAIEIPASCLTDSAGMFLPVDQETVSTQVEPDPGEVSLDQNGNRLLQIKTDDNHNDQDDTLPFTSKLSDVPTETEDKIPLPLSDHKYSSGEVDNKDPNSSNTLETVPLRNSSGSSSGKVFQAEYAEDIYTKDPVNSQIDLSLAEEDPLVLSLAEVEASNRDIKPNNLASSDDDFPSNGKMVTNKTSAADSPEMCESQEQQLVEIEENALAHKLDSSEVDISYCVENNLKMNLDGGRQTDEHNKSSCCPSAESENFQEEYISNLDGPDQDSLVVSKDHVSLNHMECATPCEVALPLVSSPDTSNNTISDFPCVQPLDSYPDSSLVMDKSDSSLLTEKIAPQTKLIDTQSFQTRIESSALSHESLSVSQHLDHGNELSDESLNTESFHQVEASHELTQSNQMQSNDMVLQTNPGDCSDFCPAPLLPEASVLDPPRPNSHELDYSEEAKPPNLLDMPPLPPLPPMQWRIGKLQRNSLSSGRGSSQHSVGMFPPNFPSTSSEKTRIGLPTLNGSNIQLSKPLLSLPDIESEYYQHDSGGAKADSMVNYGPSLPNMSSHNEILVLSQTQSVPVTLTERPHGLPAGEAKRQPNTDPFSPAIFSSDSEFTHSSDTLHDEKTESSQQLSTKANLDTEEHDHLDLLSVEKHPERIPTPLVLLSEQSSHVYPLYEGGMVWSSDTSIQNDEKPSEIRPMKLLRPRSPLIDAVAAHDKSKLKKVAERSLPQIQKVDEKDSLLEQIRTKSFNLKPAVATRPSVQGPTTNLKVAAILEKAKTIRQAFAGSDEDDDDDSWSDS